MFRAVLLSLLLAGCGFQLRGDPAVGIRTIQVSSAGPSQVAAEIRRTLATGPTRVVTDPKDAQAQQALPPAPHAWRQPWPNTIDTIDPNLASSVETAHIADQLFSGLVELSPEFDIMPLLARTWELSEDGREYVFHLRRDARWSDGTPLTAHDLGSVFVAQRIKAEQDARTRQREAAGRVYVPKESYHAGDDLVFPALDWKRGRVIGTRPAVNPELGPFDVMTVVMDQGQEMMSAAALQDHALNEEPLISPDQAEFNVETILDEYGSAIEKKFKVAQVQDNILLTGKRFGIEKGIITPVEISR